MAKTKVVQKNANRRRSKAKGQETDQDSAGSDKRGFFCHFFDSFSLFNTKRLITKASLEVSLVSLTLRAYTVF